MEWDYRNYPYSDEGIWGAASNGDLDRLKKKLMGMGLFHLREIQFRRSKHIIIEVEMSREIPITIALCLTI